MSQTLITGVYRSGSEYFAQVISGHPELVSRMYNIDVMKWAYKQYDPIEDPANLRRAIEDIAARNRLRYDFAIDADRIFTQCRERGVPGYGSLYDVIMSELFCDAAHRHWAEKCQLLWRELPDFLSIMPNGRAIILIRDPRSVLASFKKFTFVPPPAYLGAIFNAVDAFTHALRYRAELPADRFLVVRYEDTVADPPGMAAKVYRFLGLDPDRAVYDPSRWGQDGVPWKSNSAFQDVGEQFDRRRSIERWRETLEDWEVALTEAVCGPTMREFGYKLTGAPLDWPEALRKFIAHPQIGDWFTRWLLHGEGVQSYPLDPRKVENWSETRDAAAPKRHEGDKLKRLLVIEGTEGRFPVVESQG